MIVHSFGTDLASAIKAASDFEAALGSLLVIEEKLSYKGIGPATGSGAVIEIVVAGTGYYPGENFTSVPGNPNDLGFSLTVTSVGPNGALKTVAVTVDPITGKPLTNGNFLSTTQIVATNPDYQWVKKGTPQQYQQLYGNGATFKQGYLWQFSAKYKIITLNGGMIADEQFIANGIGQPPVVFPAGVTVCACPFAIVGV